jgi:hypothetical protein
VAAECLWADDSGPVSDGRGKSVPKVDSHLHTELMTRLPVGRSGVTVGSLTPWPHVPNPNKSIYSSAKLFFRYFSGHRKRLKLVSSSPNDKWAAMITILFRMLNASE